MKSALGALILFVVFLAGATTPLAGHRPQPALANPSGAPIVAPSTIFIGDSTGLVASWNPDEQGPAVLAASNDIGDFISASAVGGNDFGLVSGLGTSVITIADDVDALIEGNTTVSAVFKCTATGTTTFTLTHQGQESGESSPLSCVLPSGGGGGGSGSQATQGVIPGVGQVVLTAHPNILPCEGGTTLVEAEVVSTTGAVLGGYEFRFHTNFGVLVQTSPDTAKLTLGPNQTKAKVTATIFEPTGEVTNVQTTVDVQLLCNDFATVVVTASPNVIECTGTSTITASVRDVNGHVVPGVGFHFVTSAGLLEVSPNNASNKEGTAKLTLRPGDGNATVVVSVGEAHGTYEEEEDVEGQYVGGETGMVTVQQRCLSTTTGQIRVNSSSVNVACGENVFIGLHVVDEDIQTVVDDTPITLIATAGGFYGGVVEGSQSLLPAAQVPTSHGEANAIYTAPLNFNGEVRITAASGDVYGIRKLNVTCVTGTAAPSGGAGTAAPPCVPIGDGICITPPNTGRNQITPPSTGSAGLRAAESP